MILHDELIKAFSDLTPMERRGIALTMQQYRNERAAEGTRWASAWAHVYAVISAAAFEADRVESSTLRAMEGDCRGQGPTGVRWLADDGEPDDAPFNPERQKADQAKLDAAVRAGWFDND